MTFLESFGAYVPARVVTSEEIGARVDTSPEWIRNVSGIDERRFAEAGETVVDMAVCAAKDCLGRAGAAAASLGMILVSSGSPERRFPGPASAVAQRLGLSGVPAIDIPMASAGSLFAMHLAHSLAAKVGRILVVAAEKMSSVVLTEPLSRDVAVLFGDGAGACLIHPDGGVAQIRDSLICSDGAFADDLRLEFGQPLSMNGRMVILQASRKIPGAISTVLERNGIPPAEVDMFLMHQANQNLIVRVAQALGVATEKFYSNIHRYGNTSSASMLIAAAEWQACAGFRPGIPAAFAAFGAGFHWGALLAVGC